MNFGGAPIGDFVADLLVDNKIIFEVKAVRYVQKDHIDQLFELPESLRFHSRAASEFRSKCRDQESHILRSGKNIIGNLRNLQ